MANTETLIQIRHSTVSGNVPGTLADGELAINTADALLYFQDPEGNKKKFTIGPVIDEGFPPNPYHRQLFWSAEEGALKIYYVDEDGTGQWVDTNGSGIGQVDLTGYATETYVNSAIANANISADLTGYATESFVNTQIDTQTLKLNTNVYQDVFSSGSISFYTLNPNGGWGPNLNYISVADFNNSGLSNVMWNSIDVLSDRIYLTFDWNSGASPYGRQQWSFSSNGGLYFPDGTVQSTAYAGLAGAVPDVDGGTNYDPGFRDIPQVIQNADADFSLSDRGKHWIKTIAGDFVWKIPNNSLVPFPIGTVLIAINDTTSGSAYVFPADVGVTLVNGTTNVAYVNVGPGEMRSILKIGTNRWKFL